MRTWRNRQHRRRGQIGATDHTQLALADEGRPIVIRRNAHAQIPWPQLGQTAIGNHIAGALNRRIDRIPDRLRIHLHAAFADQHHVRLRHRSRPRHQRAAIEDDAAIPAALDDLIDLEDATRQIERSRRPGRHAQIDRVCHFHAPAINADHARSARPLVAELDQIRHGQQAAIDRKFRLASLIFTQVDTAHRGHAGVDRNARTGLIHGVGIQPRTMPNREGRRSQGSTVHREGGLQRHRRSHGRPVAASHVNVRGTHKGAVIENHVRRLLLSRSGRGVHTDLNRTEEREDLPGHAQHHGSLDNRQAAQPLRRRFAIGTDVDQLIRIRCIRRSERQLAGIGQTQCACACLE